MITKEDWVELGKVCCFVGGGTPSKKEPDYWNGNIPWTWVKDIKDIFWAKTKSLLDIFYTSLKPSAPPISRHASHILKRLF